MARETSLPQNSPVALPPVAFFNRGEGAYQTGGYLYNQQMRAAIVNAGASLTIYEHVDDLAQISPEDLVIIDSLMIPELAQTLKNSNISPTLLYHLPPDMGGLPIAVDAIIKKIELRSQIVVTGDTSFKHMQSRLQGHSIPLYKIEPGVAPDWRQKHLWPARAEKLLMVASYQPGKGLENLPEILSAIKTHSWTLQIIGEDRFNPAFKQQLQNEIQRLELHNRVIMCGPMAQEAINQAMLDADLLLQLSEFETYSMVTAEAITAGLPVLSSPTGNQQRFVGSGRVQYLSSFTVRETIYLLEDLLQGSSAYQRLCGPRPHAMRSWRAAQQEFLHCIAIGRQKQHLLPAQPSQELPPTRQKQEHIVNGI